MPFSTFILFCFTTTGILIQYLSFAYLLNQHLNFLVFYLLLFADFLHNAQLLSMAAADLRSLTVKCQGRQSIFDTELLLIVLLLCILVLALRPPCPWRVKFACLDLLTISNNGSYIFKVQPETLLKRQIISDYCPNSHRFKSLSAFKSSVTQDCFLKLFHKTVPLGFRSFLC